MAMTSAAPAPIGPMARVLMVEDDPSCAQGVSAALHHEGYDVRVLPSAEDFSETLLSYRPDIVLLDVYLPGSVDGFELGVTTRAEAGVPVVFVTAADDLRERLKGFEVGADDFIVKPFALAELLSRIRAVLRRSGRLVSSTWELRDLVVDESSRVALRAGQVLDLSRTEFELLLTLVKAPGRVFTKPQLLAQVWGFDAFDPNLVEVYVSSLRRKLETHGPRLLFTERGKGYVMRG
jgi:two-component system, OmpR family, response regulator